MRAARRFVSSLSVATAVVLVVLVGCGSPSAPQQPASGDLAAFAGLVGTIDIAGGTAHIPVMQEAAKRVMKAYPAIRITVAGGGSGVGVQKVGEGLVDIGDTGRPVKPAENERYGLTSYPFAIDGVAVVVHPSNPIDGLTTQQTRDVFAGKIASWKDLGGAEGAVDLYGRDEASGTREVFWKQLLDQGEVAPGTNVVPSNGAMKTAIAGDRAGIGYLSIGHLDETVSPVAIDGVQPTQENAKAGTYRVVRKLYMNTKGEPSPLVRAFLDYIRSGEGAEIVATAGYIPIGG